MSEPSAVRGAEHILIVFCHPLADSFGARLLEEYTTGLTESGRSYEVADLYAEGFDPVFHAADYVQFEGGPLPQRLLEEQARVERADAIVVISPLWWLGTPAMLKGWFDRVWSNGWAYEFANDPEGSLLPLRPYLFLMTTGGSAGSFDRRGYADALDALIRGGILGWCGVSESSVVLLHDTGFDVETTGAHLDFARATGAGATVVDRAPSPDPARITVLNRPLPARTRRSPTAMDAQTAIRSYCDAWVAKDNAGIAQLFAEGGVFVDPLHERPLIGPDDISRTNQSAVDELDDVHIELFMVRGAGDCAVAEGRMTAKVIGGGALDFEFAMVAETANGLITRLTEYFDTSALQS
ncbi:NAD(P)H-dependent oxidoreductase [Sciscionella marina]|uniref:NAD(P)H-dependent oxidoreductase n=1 Tax=Sciscionella marina TaxID=508770 RepID=UPI0003A38F31|nr:NAD(P)H-dependent oxidoreductase [Sciscionella marina]